MVGAQDYFGFHCTACGACCNSPPQMTVPELFRHESVFVGCLSLRKVRRPHEGRALPGGHVLSAADVAQYDEQVAPLLFRAAFMPDHDLALITQGFDYPSLNRCPALASDGRCSVYTSGRPLVCGVVPLDDLLPDRLQAMVLAARSNTARFLGADCISHEGSEGHGPLFAEKRVVDEGFAQALSARRHALGAEKRFWAHQVHALMASDLLRSPEILGRLPADGFLSLPLAPVIMVLASLSRRLHERCLQFLEQQVRLITISIEKALVRRQAQDKATTEQLRGFLAAYRALQAALARQAAPVTTHAEAEAWLLG